MLREYLRVSVDRSGRKRSPDEQHHDHEYDARERGWDLHPKPYRDLGSASRYARKARSDFDRLVADIEKGEFSANILGLWEGSRGSRKVGEWVQLVEALEERGILVWIHVRRRLFDPRNPHDRADLLSDAIKHELSSAETSDRSKRAASANAAAGKPHGKFQRGYKRIYDETTRKLVQQVHDPEWAPLIEELFDRGLRREGLHRIAEDWKARGIVHSQGARSLSSSSERCCCHPRTRGCAESRRRTAPRPTWTASGRALSVRRCSST
jgi:DNA invertase Pin-like site-specific DNA recombinase